MTESIKRCALPQPQQRRCHYLQNLIQFQLFCVVQIVPCCKSFRTIQAIHKLFIIRAICQEKLPNDDQLNVRYSDKLAG